MLFHRSRNRLPRTFGAGMIGRDRQLPQRLIIRNMLQRPIPQINNDPANLSFAGEKNSGGQHNTFVRARFPDDNAAKEAAMRLVHGLISRGAELRQKRVNFRARGRERRRRPSQQRIHAKLSQMTRSDFSGLSGKFRELRFAQ